MRRVQNIGVAARAERWKRLDRLLTAVANLPPHVATQLRVHVFGEGPELPYLRRQAWELGLADRIVHHGQVGACWTGRCDVLVSTCEIEAFGRTVVEAGAVGVPQIVPDEGGTAELIIPGMTGLRYDVADPDALIRALVEVASWSPVDYQRYSVSARVHARRFSLTGCPAAYVRLAAELLNDCRGANATT